jgi:hypothetical protein
VEITTYNHHVGSFLPSLGRVHFQDYSGLARSRRRYAIIFSGGGSG